MRCFAMSLAGVLCVSCADTATGGNASTSTGEPSTDTRAATVTGPTAATAQDTADGTGTSTGGGPQVPEFWQPGVVLPSDDQPHPRGLLDRRGLVHTHSPYSHDACDGEPRDADGNLDAPCTEDIREALCRVQHDYVMFTNHVDSFADSEFPDVLHHDPARGDTLLERGGRPVANWAACDTTPGVAPTLILAGCESNLMPVALPEHAPGRGKTYGTLSAEAITELQDVGAVVLVSHTEDWDVQQLVDLPLDGFEMYNLHANLLLNFGAGAELLGRLANEPDTLPHSDLFIMPIWEESPEYLERWGAVLAQGVRRVTVAATDSHRNAFTQQLPDGERVDSFRRMMQWFSNHLLLTGDGNGGFDDRDLADALRTGRVYAAFEYLGYPRGFDAYIQAGDTMIEIGGEVPLAEAPQITVTAPTVRLLDPDATAPQITVHVLLATPTGFDEVASGDDQLTFTPTTAGAYRAEVRIAPRHLEAYLGAYGELAQTPRVWIYANPFYVN